jgi:hypothetical protein
VAAAPAAGVQPLSILSQLLPTSSPTSSSTRSGLSILSQLLHAKAARVIHEQDELSILSQLLREPSTFEYPLLCPVHLSILSQLLP